MPQCLTKITNRPLATELNMFNSASYLNTRQNTSQAIFSSSELVAQGYVASSNEALAVPPIFAALGR